MSGSFLNEGKVNISLCETDYSQKVLQKLVNKEKKQWGTSTEPRCWMIVKEEAALDEEPIQLQLKMKLKHRSQQITNSANKEIN